MSTKNTSVKPDLRTHLYQSLVADLVGPYSLAADSTEVLKLPPSRWYLTGFLAPQDSAADPATAEDGKEADDEEAGAGVNETVETENSELALNNDALGAGSDEDDDEFGATDIAPSVVSRLPSSLGLTIHIPEKGTVTVTLRYADYRRINARKVDPEASARRTYWQRQKGIEVSRELVLDDATLRAGIALDAGIRLQGLLVTSNTPGVDRGTRTLSLFVVNQRSDDNHPPVAAPGEEPRAPHFGEHCMYQVELELRHSLGLIGRFNQRGGELSDKEEQINDLQFRHCVEWAVGHGVSVEIVKDQDKVVGARTCWLPITEVKRVKTRDVPGVEIRMETLAQLSTPAAIKTALSGIVSKYGEWIALQRAESLTGARKKTQEELCIRAEQAQTRIQNGIEGLANDPLLLEAFCVMNAAMALQARQRNPSTYKTREPSWRLFQLAFVLLNIKGISDPSHADRELVDLIFFPTGGGKTEAYLGVIAFTLALRRMRAVQRPDQGLGVSVILRYTLRLLTLDQLARASTLICALEHLRRARCEKDDFSLGRDRFSIGLWVGRSATANRFPQLAEELRQFRSGGHSPFPLQACPWCQTPFVESSFELLPNAKSAEAVRVGCVSADCPFAPGQHSDGVPVLFVDEHIYQELPAFIIATVDKFAMLPWLGHTGMLFGHVTGRKTKPALGPAFVGPANGALKKGGQALPNGLLPPDSIVQDELHLISGPLGTMVGLYESAVLSLCSTGTNGPKIIASTATVRRAGQQIQALFGRRGTRMFPPPGVNDSETFFAEVDHENHGRMYVGVAAPSRAMKKILIQTYLALLGGAQKLQAEGHGDDADAYMSVVGYFNSLRELGGMRRLVADEIHHRVAQAARDKMPVDAEGPNRWIATRHIKDEPLELTSRESTAAIAKAKQLLDLDYKSPEHVDVVLASNMISVGVDIERLGLMVVAGQPKSTSEYIQASSRVGRRVDKPGLVITVYNTFKPRDRSHYERFVSYHQCFYRYVEATSVTPFSPAALGRGLAGVLVAMVRLLNNSLTAPDAVTHIAQHKDAALAAVLALAKRAAEERPMDDATASKVRSDLESLGKNMIAAWEHLVASGDGQILRYSPIEKGPGTALLFGALDSNRPPSDTKHGKFCAPMSMRDVEPSVHLWKVYDVKAQDETGGAE